MSILPRITRDPALADVVGLSNRLSRLLNDGLLGAEWQSPDGPATAWVPPVDIFEEANAIRIMGEIPGVRPEDVRLTVENHALPLHGPKHKGAEERADRGHSSERTYGAFERDCTLPPT